jgi:hypothetical protein
MSLEAHFSGELHLRQTSNEIAHKSSKIVPLGAPFFNYLKEILDFPLAISTSICHSTATIYSGLHLFIGITGLPWSGEFSQI